jgi:hypothetical protein
VKLHGPSTQHPVNVSASKHPPKHSLKTSSVALDVRIQRVLILSTIIRINQRYRGEKSTASFTPLRSIGMSGKHLYTAMLDSGKRGTSTFAFDLHKRKCGR